MAGVYKRFSLTAAREEAKESAAAVLEQAIPVRQQAAVRAPFPFPEADAPGYVQSFPRPLSGASLYTPADLGLQHPPLFPSNVRILLASVSLVNPRSTGLWSVRGQSTGTVLCPSLP